MPYRTIRNAAIISCCTLISLESYSQRIVCDETCRLADAPPASAPVKASATKTKEPEVIIAPETGFAVVSVSFMTSVTHPEIKRLIKENYPSAKVILLDEIGIAGPYPAPGITRKAKDEFQEKLEEMGVDAVISGNGGCGLCTPKETGSCIAAEYVGVPSVLIAGPGFAEQAKYTARNKVQTMPGGGYATIKIELPANWDALMKEAGYRPLKEFCLK